MWQKCPVCNGTGKVSDTLSNSTSATCTVCQGKKIISELTGLPPVGIPG
jgi:DnaJ-class molecular chaperone